MCCPSRYKLAASRAGRSRRRMLRVRVSVRARLFVRGERWLGHGQGDALIFPWAEREVAAAGAAAAAMLRSCISRATRPTTNRAYVRGPPPFPIYIAIGLAENSIRARGINLRGPRWSSGGSCCSRSSADSDNR